MNLHSKIPLYTSVFGVCASSSYLNLLKDIYFKQYDNISNQGKDEEYTSNGGSSKIFSSSCEPPRAWARERA